MDKFYCCFVDGTCGFAKKHFSYMEARKEATRLARKERMPVFILEAIELGQLAEQPVIFEELKQKEV